MSDKPYSNREYRQVEVPSWADIPDDSELDALAFRIVHDLRHSPDHFCDGGVTEQERQHVRQLVRQYVLTDIDYDAPEKAFTRRGGPEAEFDRAVSVACGRWPECRLVRGHGGSCSDRETSAPDPAMDWQQVGLNGGPPCFAVTSEQWHGKPRYCGRAARWGGHDADHKFVSLDDLLADARGNRECVTTPGVPGPRPGRGDGETPDAPCACRRRAWDSDREYYGHSPSRCWRIETGADGGEDYVVTVAEMETK